MKLKGAAFAVLLSLPSLAAAEDIGPGNLAVSSVDATNLFASVCAENRADLASGEAKATELGFVENGDTGTYYDNTRDLSFKFMPDNEGFSVCSMVFKPKGEVLESLMFIALGAGVQDPEVDDDLHFARGTLPDGTVVETSSRDREVNGATQTYVRARVARALGGS